MATQSVVFLGDLEDRSGKEFFHDSIASSWTDLPGVVIEEGSVIV